MASSVGRRPVRGRSSRVDGFWSSPTHRNLETTFPCVQDIARNPCASARTLRGGPDLADEPWPGRGYHIDRPWKRRGTAASATWTFAEASEKMGVSPCSWRLPQSWAAPTRRRRVLRPSQPRAGAAHRRHTPRRRNGCTHAVDKAHPRRRHGHHRVGAEGWHVSNRLEAGRGAVSSRAAGRVAARSPRRPRGRAARRRRGPRDARAAPVQNGPGAAGVAGRARRRECARARAQAAAALLRVGRPAERNRRPWICCGLQEDDARTTTLQK